MGERFRTQEGELDLGGADDEGEAALGFEGLAAVDREAEQGAVFAADLEFGLAVEDDRAVRERVGADRREHEDRGGGVDERTAGGEVVGRRPRGRGEDESVGAVFVDAGAVGEHGEAAHAEDVARLDHDIIERQGEAAVGEADLEEGALLDAEVAAEDGVQRSADVFARVGGEEAELAAVDAEERHAFEGGGLRDAEEGAVAADDAAGVGPLEGGAADRPAVGDGEGHAGFLGGFLDRTHDVIHPGLGAVDDEREAADGHE